MSLKLKFKLSTLLVLVLGYRENLRLDNFTGRLMQSSLRHDAEK